VSVGQLLVSMVRPSRAVRLLRQANSSSFSRSASSFPASESAVHAASASPFCSLPRRNWSSSLCRSSGDNCRFDFRSTVTAGC